MKTRSLIAALASMLACHAQAHITIAQPSASAGSYTKVVLQVTHGCTGSATTALTVHIPDGLLVAKPMPKPGWSLQVEQAPLKPAVQLHGRSLNETTSVIRWQGGPLANEFFDEFTLHGKLSDAASGTLAFRVVQTCEKGEIDWRGSAGSDKPAPVLRVEPATSHSHH